MKIGLLIVLLLAAVHLTPTVQTELTVTAVNKLNLARQNETIEINAKDLAPRYGDGRDEVGFLTQDPWSIDQE